MASALESSYGVKNCGPPDNYCGHHLCSECGNCIDWKSPLFDINYPFRRTCNHCQILESNMKSTAHCKDELIFCSQNCLSLCTVTPEECSTNAATLIWRPVLMCVDKKEGIMGLNMNWSVLMYHLLQLIDQCKELKLKKLMIAIPPVKGRVAFWRACEGFLRRFSSLQVEYHDLSKLRLNNEYVLDMYRASTLLTRDVCVTALKSSNESTLKLGTVMEPIMYALDIHHLKPDYIFDTNRRLATVSQYLEHELWHNSNCIKRIAVAAVPKPLKDLPFQLNEQSLLVVTHQLTKVFCPPKDTETNPIFTFYQHCVYPFLKITKNVTEITVWREQKYGGIQIVNDEQHLKHLILSGLLYPADLKLPLLDFLTLRLFERLPSQKTPQIKKACSEESNSYGPRYVRADFHPGMPPSFFF